MKARIFIFRSIAILVAVGGALVSVSAKLVANQSHVKYTVGGTQFCSTVGTDACSTTTGLQYCTVVVNRNGSPVTATAWNQAPDGTRCATRRLRPGTFTPITKANPIPPTAVIIN